MPAEADRMTEMILERRTQPIERTKVYEHTQSEIVEILKKAGAFCGPCVRVCLDVCACRSLCLSLYADLFLCLAPYIGLSQNVFTNVPVGPWRCYSPAGIEAAEEAPESKDLDNYLQTCREHGQTRKTLPKADFAIKIGCVYFYMGPHMSIDL